MGATEKTHARAEEGASLLSWVQLTQPRGHMTGVLSSYSPKVTS